MRTILGAVLFCLGLGWWTDALAQSPTFSGNAESIAVVVGNKSYKRASTVDFAHNDAEAVKAWLTGTLGFREQNVFLVKDATQSELNQLFGSETNPQGGLLWRSVVAGRSNVFVYYSGHGVPDLATRQAFLLPQDGNPNVSESGYALQTLYRNLELVRQKIGPQRQLIVMIDACFTGETGRKGESLLAVSAPGFTPAKPRVEGGVIKLIATSGSSPANWDESQKLGLFTSRFLMGVAGLARPVGAPQTGPLAWSDLQRYLKDSVEAAARRDSGREQAPEIDLASIALPVTQPVPAVARAVALALDEANWQRAKAAGERGALEAYVARCGETCGYREAAMALLLDQRRSGEAATDEQNWIRLGGSGRYEDYLKGCGAVCAYRSLAESYLRQARPGSTQGRRDRNDTERANFYIEVPGTPDKPRMEQGRVLWRLDSDIAGPGKPEETIVRATIEIADAGLSLDFTIRRNIDSAFPASHIIGMRFSTSGEAAKDAIREVGVPQFKLEEGERGAPLSAVNTALGDNLFVAALSKVPVEAERNLELLRNYNWIDIPVRFGSGRRAIIAMEMGNTGSGVVARALSRWRK